MSDSNQSNSMAMVTLLPYVILGGLGIAAYFIIKGQLNKAGQALGILDSDELIKASKDEIGAIKVRPELLTNTESEFKSYASRLLNAMEGAGTDEKEIFSVLSKIRNREDWLKLQKVFGTPSNQTLRSWLNSELGDLSVFSKSDREKVDEIIRRLEIQRYKVFTNNTIKSLKTVTAWLPEKGEMKPKENFPDKKEIGTFIKNVIVGKGARTQPMTLVKLPSGKYYYFLTSQITRKEY